MSHDQNRYARQLQLDDIGEEGQARLLEAHLEVHGGDGAIIEAEYLHRAGVGQLTLLPHRAPTAFAHEAAFEFAAPRRIGAGAWRALDKIRRVAVGHGDS